MVRDGDPLTFYPGTTNVNEAQPITLAIGQEFDARRLLTSTPRLAAGFRSCTWRSSSFATTRCSRLLGVPLGTVKANHSEISRVDTGSPLLLPSLAFR
jgi:hypothetical protein